MKRFIKGVPLLFTFLSAQDLSITTGVVGKDARFLLERPSATYLDSLRKAARAGQPSAQMAMVEYFQLVDLKPDSARLYLHMAVKAGVPEAQYLLGVMYLRGVEGPKRPAEGRRLLEQAAAQNHILAMRVLYEVLEPPDSLSPLYVKVLPHDATQAFRYALRAAELGDAPSMVKVSRYYATGKGTTQNDSLAENWLLKAAEKGYLPAFTLLAEWYTSSKAWNEEKARFWAQRVLSNEYAPAEDQIRARVALYYAENFPSWMSWFRQWLILPPQMTQSFP
ncbi:MAG: sel1 repeat family protein [Bacteroidia bacterium]|nr:sel1 repeat family protein [Bacteroidia bacterium]MDW8416771.1 tetratricopeptide repeat protein [Bacteroidia bacterium]